MDILFGLLIGFAASVPIGPIGILSVTQRMKHGFVRGYSVASAAALMDVLYCLVAIEAASFVTHVILRYSHIMKTLGSAVLVIVSIGVFRQSRTFDVSRLLEEKPKKGTHPVLLTILLYLSGPTILAFWLTVGGLALAHKWIVRNHPSALLFALACGIGSALWYFILLKFLLRSAEKLKSSLFRKIFLALGVVLLVLAVLNLYSAWTQTPPIIKSPGMGSIAA